MRSATGQGAGTGLGASQHRDSVNLGRVRSSSARLLISFRCERFQSCEWQFPVKSVQQTADAANRGQMQWQSHTFPEPASGGKLEVGMRECRPIRTLLPRTSPCRAGWGKGGDLAGALQGLFAEYRVPFEAFANLQHSASLAMPVHCSTQASSEPILTPTEAGECHVGPYLKPVLPVLLVLAYYPPETRAFVDRQPPLCTLLANLSRIEWPATRTKSKTGCRARVGASLIVHV